MEQQKKKLMDELSAMTEETFSKERALEIQREWESINEQQKQLVANYENAKTAEERINAGQVSKDFGNPENHINNRTPESVDARSVKAFQFDHPELHQHFVEAAKMLQHMILRAQTINATTRRRAAGSKYATSVKSRYDTPVTNMQNLGVQLDRGLKCCEDIINNNGQENYADAKRVEMILDDILTNGYISVGSKTIQETNTAYIEAKSKIAGADPKFIPCTFENFAAEQTKGLSIDDEMPSEEELRAQWEA